MEELINYIDWNNLCEDNNLKHGDLSPEQHIKLEQLLQEFINQNK